jgi:DNA polymerase-3 subunit gamma/tau
MAYQSLYRKYRPQTFSDVVGQGHVARTLQNALASGRIAHGYLFTGTRGTAKTTIARILAKALNCEAHDKPVAEPCNKCGACTSITAGHSIDVIEMDAASHRGVADIEEVRKAVGYGPMELRYKVFIIDEAHQLSSDAKDAFLKTLEEPPDNVVFILATTEPQAIPITIRSRCQQFDFKRGTLTDIAGRLRYVLDAEGVTYIPEALNLVARGAEGSYRDSLSLLEQVLAFSPRHISPTDVDTVLGTLDSEMLARVTQAISRRDAAASFALAGELLDAGKEARTLLKTMAAHFRDLMLVSVGGPAVAAELTPEEVGKLQQEARAFTPPQMMRAMDILNEAQGETRWNNQHRLLVELTFLKLMTLDGPATQASAAPVQFVTAPIVFNNAPVQAAPPATPVAVATVVATAPVAPVAPTPTPKTVTPPVAEPVSVATPAPVVETPAVLEADTADEEDKSLPASYFAGDDTIDDEDDYTPDDEEDTDDTPVANISPSLALDDEETGAITGGLGDEIDDRDDDPGPTEPPYEGPGLFDDLDDSEPAPLPATVAAATPPAAVIKPVALPITPEEDDDEEDISEPLAEPPLVAATIDVAPVAAVVTQEPPVVATPPAPTPAPQPEPEPEDDETPDGVTLDRVWQLWGHFLRDAEKISMKAKILLADAQPAEVLGKTIVIAFPQRMNFDMMEAPDKREFVRKLLARTLGVEAGRIAVKFILSDGAPPPPPRQKTKKKIERNPIAEIDLLDQISHEPARPYQPSNGGYNGNGNSNGHNNGHGGGYSPPAYSPPPPPQASTYAYSAPPPPEDTGFAPPPSRDWGAPAVGNGKAPIPAYSSGKHPLEDHPLVQEARSLFGGDIVED